MDETDAIFEMMGIQKKHPKNLIITIFSEKTVPRSFEVPILWIHRMSMMVMFFVMVGILSFAWAVKLSWLQHQRVVPLEVIPAAVPSPSGLDPLPAIGVSDMKPDAFISDPPQETPSVVLPLFLENFKTKMKGSTLMVKFALEVQKEKGELSYQNSYQGKIIVIAKGPGMYFVYPEGALSFNTDHPLDPSQGEPFSVSRYREVNASFHLPATDNTAISCIETLIFNKDQELLLKHMWEIEE